MFSLTIDIGPIHLDIYIGHDEDEAEEYAERTPVEYESSTPSYIDTGSLSCLDQGWHFALQGDDDEEWDE